MHDLEFEHVHIDDAVETRQHRHAERTARRLGTGRVHERDHRRAAALGSEQRRHLAVAREQRVVGEVVDYRQRVRAGGRRCVLGPERADAVGVCERRRVDRGTLHGIRSHRGRWSAFARPRCTVTRGS